MLQSFKGIGCTQSTLLAAKVTTRRIDKQGLGAKRVSTGPFLSNAPKLYSRMRMLTFEEGTNALLSYSSCFNNL
jgi:hypothetical protein